MGEERAQLLCPIIILHLILLIPYRISQASLSKYSKVSFSYRQYSPWRANILFSIFLFKQRTSDNDGRSDVNDSLNNSCVLVYLWSCVFVYWRTCELYFVFLCTCVILSFFTCVLVYMCTYLFVFLCTCVIVYLCCFELVFLCTFELVFLCPFELVFLCT